MKEEMRIIMMPVMLTAMIIVMTVRRVMLIFESVRMIFTQGS